MEVSTEQNKEYRYVGFQGRLFATIIDLFLSTLILLPFASTSYPQEVIDILAQVSTGQMSNEAASHELLQYIAKNPSTVGDGVGGALLEFVISAIVIIMFWVYKAATPGKMFLKMKIVDFETGGKPKTGNLINRYLGYFVSGIPIFLGFFWIAIDKKKQGWHDKMAGTVVVYTDKNNNRNFYILFAIVMILLAISFIS